MKYLMLHAVEESRLEEPFPDGFGGRIDSWLEEMRTRGVLLDGGLLRRTDDATTVRGVGGETEVTDGPFAETKEQVVGYDVLDCPDLDTAVAVASAHPTLELGAIEVRAFEDGMPDPEVPEQVAEGKRRYLMLVCADMRRAMAERSAATAEALSPDLADVPEPEPSDGDDPMGIDAWVDSVSDRRLYGWPLTFPDTAVTVRRVDDRVVTTDGPFAETKEQVAGYDLLECRDLDEALAAATTHPVAGRGAIEIRPLLS
jgi:hypothetical protein